MKTKRTNGARQKLAKTLVSVLVLAFVILPILGTLNWLHTVAFGNDPRKVIDVPAMQVRAIDKQGELKPFKQPIVTITFDDGWVSAYKHGLPLLNKYGFPTTQYIIAGEFKHNVIYVNEAQVRSWRDNGHEIGSHTFDHPDMTTISPAAIRGELVESKQILGKFGRIYDFAAPYSAMNAETNKLVKQTYDSGRNTFADPRYVDWHDVNEPGHFDRYSITAYAMRETTTMADLKRLVDYTVKHDGWLVLTYHQIEDNQTTDSEAYSVSAKNLQEQLEYLHDAPLRTGTVHQVLTALDRENK